MEHYLHLVNDHIDDLIKICINEKTDKGIGIAFLDFTNPNKMDCRYVALGDEIFPNTVRERYYDRIISVPSSILFFLIYDGTNELMYEVDLDKNSTFHKNQLENIQNMKEN